MSDFDSALAEDPLAGTPYRMVAPLARGGMGEVVEARHVALDRLVVIKLIHAQSASQGELVDRMRLEAQALARLEHPNIVRVLDFSTTPDGRPYLVMERLRGRTLKDELHRRGKLPWREAIDFASQALAGLGAVHAAGLVHRDVKLGNLFVSEGGGELRRVKLLDFGIARVLRGSSGSQQDQRACGQEDHRAPLPLAIPTEDGVTIGSPLFFSPEQAQGQAVDHRTDIYAVGVVLYMLLTGDRPFPDAHGYDALARAHVFQRPSPLRIAAPASIAPALEHAVLKALAKNPENRFASAAEFEVELLRIGAVPLGWVETQPLSPAGYVPRAAHPWERGLPEASGGVRLALRDPVQTIRLEDPGAPAAPASFSVLPPRRPAHAPSWFSSVKRRQLVPLLAWIAVTLAALGVILYRAWT